MPMTDSSAESITWLGNHQPVAGERPASAAAVSGEVPADDGPHHRHYVVSRVVSVSSSPYRRYRCFTERSWQADVPLE